MVTLFLIRHGQTAWNAEGRYQGTLDIPLDHTGRRQVLELRPRLLGHQFDAVYTSTLSRAIETATLLTEGHNYAGVTFRTAALNEMCYGHWEGQTREQIMASFPDEWHAYGLDPNAHPPFGGETRDQLQERVGTCLQELSKQHSGQTVMVACHGGVIRAAMAHALGVGPQIYPRWRFDNAGLSIIQIRPPGTPGRGTIVQANDTSHLAFHEDHGQP